MTNKEIESKILTLEADIQSRVILALVILGAKKAGQIFVRAREFDFVNRRITSKKDDVTEFEDLFEGVGLHFAKRLNANKRFVDVEYDGVKYEKEIESESIEFFIAKIKEDLQRIWKAAIFPKFDHYEYGVAMSFPNEASKLYSSVDFSKPGDFAEKMVPADEFHRKYMNEWWSPYVMYIVRRGHEEEDSKVGIEWANAMRKNFPELARNFEVKMNSDSLFERPKNIEKEVYKISDSDLAVS